MAVLNRMETYFTANCFMFKARQRVGKYQIEKKLGEGGFSVVYRAYDTVEGIRVALKVPHAKYVTKEVLDDFRKEVRLVAMLNHANILPLKNADFIDGHFVVTLPLGEKSLADRLCYRMSSRLALSYVEQLLFGLAHAHEHRIIHCDIKPENLILFPNGTLALTDFGIAKVGLRTIEGSGSGTVGYMAPEQAMGKPSYRSDVFSAGLILCRLFGGKWPEYPFTWPVPGYSRMRSKYRRELIDIVRRAVEVEPKKRFADATKMLGAFQKVKRHALKN